MAQVPKTLALFPHEDLPWVKCVPGVAPSSFAWHVILITQSPRAVKTFSWAAPKHPQLWIGKCQLEKHHLFKLYHGQSPNPMPTWASGSSIPLLSSTPKVALNPSHPLGLLTFLQLCPGFSDSKAQKHQKRKGSVQAEVAFRFLEPTSWSTL